MDKKPKARPDFPKDCSGGKEKTQYERFIQTAREVGVDESGKEFDVAISKIARTNTRVGRAEPHSAKGRK
jgi:hypothetical protein